MFRRLHREDTFYTAGLMKAGIINDDVNVMLRCDHRELNRGGGDLGGLLFDDCSQ